MGLAILSTNKKSLPLNLPIVTQPIKRSSATLAITPAVTTPAIPKGPPAPWRDQLGQPPLLSEADTPEKVAAWLAFHQAKWRLQQERRSWLAERSRKRKRLEEEAESDELDGFIQGEGPDWLQPASKRQRGMDTYLFKTRSALLKSYWQVRRWVTLLYEGLNVCICLPG
ncbi:unnamed protein product [Protopolystoma xenopodis]|uniref:Uncharacterized protein n=1 Tax=Protopolystoma xenopodis TaxID=117903 RepID=A0A448WIK0_9PLAT|nr:unnamed protein product [Protopolystoma xenopodis]